MAESGGDSGVEQGGTLRARQRGIVLLFCSSLSALLLFHKLLSRPHVGSANVTMPCLYFMLTHHSPDLSPCRWS